VSFLPPPHQVDLTKLRFEKLLPGWNVCSFDCTEADGSDPGGLQEFIQKEALTFQAEKLGVTYLVFHKNDIVAFLTVSMNCLSVEELPEKEKVPKIKVRYPVLFLGRLGVDKRYQNQNVGTYVCQWIVGLARSLSEIVGCRYLALHALPERSSFYTREPLNFVESSSGRTDTKKLLYCRIADVPSKD